MLIRSSRLPRNQSAGCLDETPLRTVHQRPPKKIAPSKTPATNASTRVRVSFIVILLFVPHLPCLPWRPNARHSNSRSIKPGHQQRQRPGMACPDSVCPTRYRAPRRAASEPTTDQPISPIMPKPNQTPWRGVAPRLELARRLRADLPAERRLRSSSACFRVRHSC